MTPRSLMESDMENQGKVFLGTGLVLGPTEVARLADEAGLASELDEYALLVPFRSDILSCVEGGSLTELARLEIKPAPDESLMATLTVRLGAFAMKFAIPLVDAVAMQWFLEAATHKRATVLLEVPETGQFGMLQVRIGVQKVLISQGNARASASREAVRRELLAEFFRSETNELMNAQKSGVKPEQGCVFVCVPSSMQDESSTAASGQSRLH